MTDARFGPGVWVVERADELPQVASAIDIGGNAQYEPLEVGCNMCRYLDAQRRRRLGGPAKPAGETRCSRITFEHVVAGHEVDRPIGVGGVRCVDHRHQISAW